MPRLLKKLTPVLVVEHIEPLLSFWNRLDMRPTVEVPDSTAPERLAFVILSGDGIELMYQTRTSVQTDMIEAALDKVAFAGTVQQSTLFVEVARLDDIEARLAGEHVVMPRRKTFYGTAEVGYADAAGNIIVFAEHQEA